MGWRHEWVTRDAYDPMFWKFVSNLTASGHLPHPAFVGRTDSSASNMTMDHFNWASIRETLYESGRKPMPLEGGLEKTMSTRQQTTRRTFHALSESARSFRLTSSMHLKICSQSWRLPWAFPPWANALLHQQSRIRRLYRIPSTSPSSYLAELRLRFLPQMLL